MVTHKRTKKKRILMMRIKKLSTKDGNESNHIYYLNDNIEECAK